MQRIKKNWLVISKLTQRIWLIFMQAVASLKICSLMGSFCPYHINFDMKKYRRVMSHNTEKWYKVWRNTDSRFPKWHDEFIEINAEIIFYALNNNFLQYISNFLTSFCFFSERFILRSNWYWYFLSFLFNKTLTSFTCFFRFLLLLRFLLFFKVFLFLTIFIWHFLYIAKKI